MPKKGANISLNSYDDIFKTEEDRQDTGEHVVMVPLDKIHPFKAHPFKVVNDEVMSTDGVMHEALAVVLAGNGVDVLVCGGGDSCGCDCCGDDESCGCGDDCEGGCCGSCGHYEPDFDGPNIGKTVRVHYEGTLDDGTCFDSSYERNEPLSFVCGSGRMIHGFDKAVALMNAGDIINIHLTPDEAYGEADPSAIMKMPIANLPGISHYISR